MLSTYSPPLLVPSFFTALRLMLQYLRQTTKAVKRFPARIRPASSDFRYERIGTLGLKNQVGEPKQIRS